ncbi:hypothetical protein HHK36_014345 [Tetracentron sinense]|uniref:Mitochondrial distribution/morphology family 35/apoptosis n=1 Tax=Tetracentron sinense TaxID=13715 RepID=A0A835DHM3_TETSI|nr:hypothetical protein HHK36_014345 [Tetracentron sinense]
MGITKEKRSSSTSPCAQLKAAYHDCFNRWYSEKFLKGQWDKEECVTEWEKYRACLSQHLEDKHLSRFLEAEALYQVDSGSPVDGGVSQ